METGRGPESHRTVGDDVHEKSEPRAAEADMAAHRRRGETKARIRRLGPLLCFGIGLCDVCDVTGRLFTSTVNLRFLGMQQ